MNKFLEKSKGIIFDVDGLLIDSEPLWYKTREAFAAKYGKTITSDIHERVVGMGMKEILLLLKNRLDLPGNIEDLMQEYRATFYHLAVEKKELTLMEGVTDVVQTLFNMGKVLAIATGGNTKGKMKEILRLFDMEKYFLIVVTSDQVRHGKPAPDIFLLTSEKMGIAKEECVILEDAVNGVQAAKNADMKVIGVQQDAVIAKKLSEEGADVVVTSLKELL